MSIWNELCYNLSENITTNTSEQIYELKVIQAFEKMGWSEFNKEILVRESVQLGSANRISPDLVIQTKDKGNLFIIEVKKPSIDIANPSFKSQLSSYMGIMRVDIGILIGNKIQIFVDGKTHGKSGIILIDEIDFTRDNPKGKDFVNLFHKSSFNTNSIELKAKEVVAKQREYQEIIALKKHLGSTAIKELFKQFILQEVIKDYSKKAIEQVLPDIDIQILDKGEKINTPSILSKQIMKPNDLQQRYTNGKQIGNKTPIGKYVKSTFIELIKDNKLSPDEVNKLQSKDYSKATFDLQFPLLAKENSTFYDRVRYWKQPCQINGELFFICSQWYETSANNDRPYYEAWLKKMKA